MGPGELLDSLRPDEAGALFGLFYYARRAKSISTNQEEWQHVSKFFELQINTGVLVGRAIPKVGLSLGMLTGGLPALSFSTFLQHDLNGFKDYRRHLKSAHLSADWKMEVKKWGCTSIQIASFLVQSLGFGVALADCFRLISVEGNDHVALNKELLARLRVAQQWISSLAARGEPPSAPQSELESSLYPDESTTSKLVSQVCEIRENSARYAWLDRSGNEAPSGPPVGKAPAQPVAATPAAPAPKASAPKEAASSKKVSYSDIPEELRCVISEDEFNSMSPEQAQAFLADIGLG